MAGLDPAISIEGHCARPVEVPAFPGDASLRSCLPFVLRRSGDLSEEPEPDPISNSAVKLLSADGTVSQDPGE